MKQEEIIKRAKSFLKKLSKSLNELNASDIDLEFCGSGYQKRYFVYMNYQTGYCFESRTKFMTKEEVNEEISALLENYSNWKKIFIFDVKTNKTIKPSI